MVFYFKRKQINYCKREIKVILKAIGDYDSLIPIFPPNPVFMKFILQLITDSQGQP